MNTRFRRLGLAALVWISACGAAVAPGDDPPPVAPYLRPQTAVRLPDGRRFNLVCMGEGAPVAILAAGLDGWSPAWGAIQPELGKITRACTFDRAGYGFSDAGPMPRDAAADVSDLRQALKAAGLPGPFVLVGHSMGGLEMRLFAYEHPELVSGLLLLDPSIEHDDLARFQSEGDKARLQAFLRSCAARARAGKIVAGEVRMGDSGPCTQLPNPKRTAEEKRRILEVYAQPSFFEALASEGESMNGRTSAEVEAARHKLGSLPLIILSSDKAHYVAAVTAGLRGRPDAEPEKLYVNWIAAHEDEARDSARGEHRILEGAGHRVYADRPDAVLAAFREVVDAARSAPK